MADKIARCPASANTTVTVHHPRTSPRPVNSGRCEHHQRAAGTFNRFSLAPLLRFHSILFPCVLQSIMGCSSLFPSFFLFLITLFSSFICSICRSLFHVFIFPTPIIPVSWFFPALLHYILLILSSELAELFVLGRKKITARRDTQRRLFFGTWMLEIERASERAGGREDCMRHKKNHPRKIGM